MSNPHCAWRRAGYSPGVTGGRASCEAAGRSSSKGPRAFDATGLPLAFDNQSIFIERIHLDRSNVTVIDHALTRPGTVDRRYLRTARPTWVAQHRLEGTALIFVGTDEYDLSGDGNLMPTRRDHLPPNLKYFRQTR